VAVDPDPVSGERRRLPRPIHKTRSNAWSWTPASSNRRRERRSSTRSLTAPPIDGGRTSCAEASRSARGPPTPRPVPSGQSTSSSSRGTSCDKVRRGSADPTTNSYLAEDAAGVPGLVQLGQLLTASDRVGSAHRVDRAIRDLVAAGSSLGGARPKAAVCKPMPSPTRPLRNTAVPKPE